MWTLLGSGVNDDPNVLLDPGAQKYCKLVHTNVGLTIGEIAPTQDEEEGFNTRCHSIRYVVSDISHEGIVHTWMVWGVDITA